MSETYITIVIVLAIYLIMNFLKSQFKERIPVNVMIAIYSLAIIYFIYITIAYYRPEQTALMHFFRIAITVGLIGYYLYQIAQLIKKKRIKI